MNKGKITIGICDDEKFFIHQIKFLCENYLEDVFDDFRFVVMCSGEEVLSYRGEVLDLLFLDIELGGMDGINVMKNILHSPYIWRIVFVSTHEELVWDTFSIKTLGFCRKPIDEKEIKKYISCVQNELKKDVMIQFKKYDEDTYVKQSEIYYIEGRGSYIEVHTKDRNFVVTGKIGEWEEKLKDTSIIRVHKSFMVNMEHIKLNGSIVEVLDLDEEIALGRTFKSMVQEKYTQFVWESMRERS